MPIIPAIAALASIATPVGTTAAAASSSSFIQPWMIPFATSGVQALHNLIAPNRQTEILSEVLSSRTEFRNALTRRASGKTFNRTSLELKRTRGENAGERITGLLIAPVWN